MATVLTLHEGGARPLLTGIRLWEETAEIAAQYLRMNLDRLPASDPMRGEIERFASYADPARRLARELGIEGGA